MCFIVRLVCVSRIYTSPAISDSFLVKETLFEQFRVPAAEPYRLGDLPLAAIIARQNLSVEEVWFLAVSLAFRSLPLIYFKGRNVLTRNTSCFFEIDSFLSCSVGTIERPIGYGSTVQSVCRVEKDSGRERVERDVSSIDQYEPCYIRLAFVKPGMNK